MKSFIHLFEIPKNYYFYDVNRNENVQVEKDVYEYLKKILRDEIEENNRDLDIEKEIQMLKEEGYLSDNRVKEIKHPATDLLETYLSRKMKMLIIQLTQNCNLRCEYCPYTYNDGTDRLHQNRDIDFETIKKALHILKDNSVDSEDISVSFYGGEPLIRFDLIKKTVNYCRKIFVGKSVSFSLTTNATLFTEEIMNFFENENFNILISLDGPKYLNDKNRKFFNSEKSVFDKVIANLKTIEKNHKKLFTNISLNMVIDPTVRLGDYALLFKDYTILNRVSIRASILEDYTIENKFKFTENFRKQYMEMEKSYYSYILNDEKLLDKKFIEAMFSEKYQELLSGLDKSMGLGYIGCPSGPCIPSIQRLFVDVDGFFYPCERISETNEFNIIGDVEKGIEIDEVEKILNISNYNRELCRNCFAFRECGFCVRSYQKQTNRILISEAECENRRRNFESKLIDIESIKENHSKKIKGDKNEY